MRAQEYCFLRIIINAAVKSDFKWFGSFYIRKIVEIINEAIGPFYVESAMGLLINSDLLKLNYKKIEKNRYYANFDNLKEMSKYLYTHPFYKNGKYNNFINEVSQCDNMLELIILFEMIDSDTDYKTSCINRDL